MRKSTSGFTIVELLIVIVVIAILATIAVVAYNGVQARAQDSKRISDLKVIAKALELHKVNTGSYPLTAFSGLGSQQGWELSSREAEGEFIAPLKTNGFIQTVPVDPINNAVEDTKTETIANKTFGYSYANYTAGTNGCDASRGRYYVIGLTLTATTGFGNHPDSPGFQCSNRNWQSEFSWVMGNFEN